MMALMALTPGISIITERIFESRFMHVSELARLGADVAIEGPSAIVKGGRPLSGAPVMASDLRASAALVIAGLAARGTTEISRVYHIDRGYDNIDGKLRKLGARIERVEINCPGCPRNCSRCWKLPAIAARQVCVIFWPAMARTLMIRAGPGLNWIMWCCWLRAVQAKRAANSQK